MPFPWLEFLSATDRASFATEVVEPTPVADPARRVSPKARPVHRPLKRAEYRIELASQQAEKGWR